MDQTGAKLEDGRLFVVGVGASAGGLEALQRLVGTARRTGEMAFVVVQHLSPDFESLMGELLAPHTSLQVTRAEQGMLVEPDHLYVMPPRHEMIIAEGRLQLSERDTARGLFLPIDAFLGSLAKDLGARSIAVILSGTGSDGSRGIRAVHEAGGLVMAQDESAKFDGMPRSAVDTGVVDLVLPPESMNDVLLRYLEHGGQLGEVESGADRDVLTRIFELLRRESGIDFGDYKASTVGRRIERRLLLTDTGNLEKYLDRIAGDPDELRSLYRDLLIGVTHFMRDQEAFDKLRTDVLPDLVDAVPPNEEMRLWVPGCATGEEPYTLAMLVAEAFRARNRPPSFRVFATDVHRASLEVASAGIYPAQAAERIPAALREQYFKPHRDGVQVSTELRGHVVFAQHNILKDAPFTRLDLLSCRNLLIYFVTAAQRKVLSVFHFALKVGGVMVMGPSESPGPISDEFEVLDARWKIFRKHRDTRLTPELHVGAADRMERNLLRIAGNRQPAEDPRVVRSRELLVEEFAPACLVVDQELKLLHTFNAASEYLLPKDGRPSLNVMDLVEGELRTVLSASVRRAQKDQKRAVFDGVLANTTRGPRRVRVTVRPLGPGAGGRGDECWAISLEPVSPEAATPAAETVESEALDVLVKERMSNLEGELRFTKENLQATIEEMEASNEELQATNEELVASNEELQSTNEELHSVNEELYTVNREYQAKISELTELTADVSHLLEATEVHTLFVDRELRLRKFTPKIGEAFHLLPQDVGRRLDSFAHDIEDQHLLEDLERVLRTGLTVEREVRDRQGHPYFLRILPYRAGEMIDGVVLTLVDMSALKRAQRELGVSEERYRTLVRAITAVVWTADAGGRFVTPQAEWEQYTGHRWEQYRGDGWLSAIHPDDRERLRQSWATAVRERRALGADGRIWSEARQSYRYFVARAAPLLDETGQIREWVGHMVDVHETKSAEVELRRRDEQIRAILDHSPTFIFLKDLAGRYLLAGRQCQGVMGVPCEQIVGKTDYELLPVSMADARRATERRVLESGQTVEVEEVVFHGDEPRTFLTSIFPLRDVQGETYAFAGISTDITERKRAAEQAQEAVERRDHFLAMLSHELRTPLGAIVNATEILNRNAIPGPANHAAQVIGRQARHMGRLIDDLLDVGRITRDQIVMDARVVDLNEALAEAVEALRPEAERKGLALVMKGHPTPLAVRGDPVRLRQIVTNLLANAITHTNQGEVAALAEEVEGAARVLVKDSGVGISPAEMGRIFELFYQAPQPLDRPRGGLGVGLSLAQTLARLHGGDVSAQSEGEGKGSTFVVTLPRADGTLERRTHPQPRQGRGLRIVVVEDNDDNRLTFEELLRDSGHEVKSARDGLTGVELILMEKPDVAFVDVGLPGMDGFSVARRVRETGSISIRLVALTGYGMPEDHARAMAAGFDRHLLKPLEVDALARLLAELASGRSPGN